MSKALNVKSTGASATIDGAKVLSKKAQENLEYLYDMYDDQFERDFIALLFEDLNYDVVKCTKALDKLSGEAEARKKIEQRTDALFNRLRAHYDEKLVDDELLRLLIEENKGDEVAVSRQIEEMTKEVKKQSEALVARMQHKFKHVLDASIVALVAAEVNYDEHDCVAQLTALSTSAPVARVETAEQFLRSIFPQYDQHVLTACFSEQNKDLARTIDHLLSMESAEPSDDDEISDEPSSDWSVMRDLFPALAAPVLQRALDEHRGDVPAAVETLLRNNSNGAKRRKAKTLFSNDNSNLGNRKQVARINQWDKGEELNSKLKLEQLQRQFPKIDREILASVFTENNFHAEKTVQCLNTIYGVPLADQPVSNTNLPNLDKQAPSTVESASDTRQKVVSRPKEVPFKTVSYKKGNSVVHGSGKQARASSQSSTELRQKIRAQLHVIQQSIWARNQYFQAACTAYCHGDGAAANALRNKGRDYEVKMSAAVRLLANYIFLLHRAEGQTISSVDLHGLQVKEARQVLHALLDLYADTQTKFLRVITGAGKHSAGGKAKLRPEVEELLQNRQLEYQLVGDGAFLVYLR